MSAILPGFTGCQECDGGLEYPTPSFSESHPLPVPCLSCSGAGQVPDSETVEVCKQAYQTEYWRTYAGPVRSLAEFKAIRAALLAYARWVKENP